MESWIKTVAVVLMSVAAVPAFAAPKAKAVGPAFPETLAAKPMFAKLQNKAVAPGVTYYAAHFKDLLGDGPEATHWLVIEWEKCGKDISLNISRNPERRECPSELANAVKAIACVNGTYHSTTDPSLPEMQLKVRGEMIPSKSTGGDGTMAFNKGEMPYIGHFNPELLTTYENVISGDGVPGLGQPLPDYKDKSPAACQARESCRAPRTFAGNNLTNKWTVIGICDGRQPGHSIGVSYVELRYLLEQWGCDPKALVSFDGGGSTMMGIKKGGKVDVVNRPSDGAPKHNTERRVAESIQIIDAKSRPDANVKGAKKSKPAKKAK